jgi:hypothetical protein
MSTASPNTDVRGNQPVRPGNGNRRARVIFNPSSGHKRPMVQLVGDPSHWEFADAIELLGREAQLVASEDDQPELILIAQSRPDNFGKHDQHHLQQSTPLSGVVALLGSWCEGETRTGRPLVTAQRIFSYEFPAWWKRQMSLRRTGRCPDWARRTTQDVRVAGNLNANTPAQTHQWPGLIVLRTSNHSTGKALADVFHAVGYSVAIQTFGSLSSVRGAIAGVWDGGQLNEAEATELKSFSAEMAQHAAPVLALLDFPRRDRIDVAMECGAVAAFGKPWLNADLIAAMEENIRSRALPRAA